MNLIERAKSILLQPKEAWATVDKLRKAWERSQAPGPAPGSPKVVFVRQKRAYSTLWALPTDVWTIYPAQCPLSSALSVCLRVIAGLCTLPGGHHEPD